MISSIYFSGIPQNNFVGSLLSSPYCKIVAVALLALLTSPTRVKADLSNSTTVALNDTEFNTTSGTIFQKVFESGRMVEQKTPQELAEMTQNTRPREIDRSEYQKILNDPKAETALFSTKILDDDENLETILDNVKGANAYFEFARVHLANKNFARAIHSLQKAANLDHVDASTALAYAYTSGTWGVEKNLKTAEKYWRQAAAFGGSEERYELGKFLTEIGQIEEGLEILTITALAKEENISAQLYLAKMYFLGTGVQIDQKKAFYWCKKAANNGDTEAKYLLGLFYEEGQGTIKSRQKSHYWLEQAAKEGHVEAQRLFSKNQHNEL